MNEIPLEGHKIDRYGTTWLKIHHYLLNKTGVSFITEECFQVGEYLYLDPKTAATFMKRWNKITGTKLKVIKRPAI